MKYIKLGLALFQKKLFINLLLVLQLVIALLAINYALATVQSQKLGIDIIEDISNQNTLIVMPSRESIMIKGNDYLDKSDLLGNYIIAEAKTLFIKIDNESVLSLIYDKALIENINVPLKKGEWTSQIITENGIDYAPLIIAYETQEYKYNDKITLFTNKGTSFSAYIAGVLNDKGQYLSLSATSNVAKSECFFNRNNRQDQGAPYLFFISETFTGEVLNNCINAQRTKFIFFEDSETLLRNYEILSNQAYVFDLETILNNSYAEFNEVARFYLPICSCIFAIGLIGIISFTALNTLQNAHYFSILYLCGSRWKNIKYIIVGYIGIIALLSLIITLITYNLAKINGYINSMNLYFSPKNVFITLTVLAIVVVISILIPYILMKKFSVTEFIRKYES